MPNMSPQIARQVEAAFAHFDPFAPFVAPKHIATALGLSASQVRRYCAQCRALRAWVGGHYRFFLEDPEHVAALTELIKLICYSRHRAG